MLFLHNGLRLLTLVRRLVAPPSSMGMPWDCHYERHIVIPVSVQRWTKWERFHYKPSRHKTQATISFLTGLDSTQTTRFNSAYCDLPYWESCDILPIVQVGVLEGSGDFQPPIWRVQGPNAMGSPTARVVCDTMGRPNRFPAPAL